MGFEEWMTTIVAQAKNAEDPPRRKTPGSEKMTKTARFGRRRLRPWFGQRTLKELVGLLEILESPKAA
jgi:hypothetical protein